MFRTVCLISFTILLLLGCTKRNKPAGLPYYNKANFTPLFLSEKQADDSITHKIAAFEVWDQRGRKLTDSSLQGKIHVANFFFAKCGVICPRMMGHLEKIVDSLKNDPEVVFMSYSVTPWADSIPALRAYADRNGFGYPNWHMCTGQTSAIYSLARRSYFAEESLGYTKDSTEFLHTEHVILVDRSLRIRGIYNGTLQLDMQQLQADIMTLRQH